MILDFFGVADLQGGPIAKRVPHRVPVYLRDAGFQRGSSTIHSVALWALRPGAHAIDQPDIWCDRDIIACLDGDLYNRTDLLAMISPVQTNPLELSDTEVLARLLLRHGPNALSHVEGDFAFGLWHFATRSLLLARDIVGIRSLYHARHENLTSRPRTDIVQPEVGRVLHPVRSSR